MCQPGYTGDACQRSVCVADCSGHGECVSIRERAERYDGMQYKYKARYSSWDADMNFGCACHEGWTGPDCTMRLCPFGDDPMTQGTKEIQSVRTFADHRDEVQSILLTADYDIDEVQVVSEAQSTRRGPRAAADGVNTRRALAPWPHECGVAHSLGSPPLPSL